MKRDLDLVRKILLKVEEHAGGWEPGELAVDGYTPEQVGHHCWLILDGGLAAGIVDNLMGPAGYTATLLCLRWEGHEFLAAARDESRWSRAMQLVKEKGGNVTLGVLTQVLTGLMRSAFGL